MRKNGVIFKNKMEEDIEMKIYHAQVNHLENPIRPLPPQILLLHLEGQVFVIIAGN